jgi:hypothetical protein
MQKRSTEMRKEKKRIKEGVNERSDKDGMESRI